MADTVGQADIRGLDIQELVTGFADEDLVLEKYARQSTTSSREIRWFQKTAGYVSPATTTGITSNLANLTSSRAVSPVTAQSWTRNTSYVKTFKLESETISDDDIEDSDVDVLGTMIKDLAIGVNSLSDTRCYNVLTENLSPSNILTTAATADGWDDNATGNPVLDILTGIQKIRAQRYIIDNERKAVLYINSIEYKNLVNYLISVKGSSAPGIAEKLMSGVLNEILNCMVVVSENATTDYALIFLPNKSFAWKSFRPLISIVSVIDGIGKKIIIKKQGEALLEHPKSVHLTTDTVV